MAKNKETENKETVNKEVSAGWGLMDEKSLQNREMREDEKNSELNLSCVLTRPISFETSVHVFFRTYYFVSSVPVLASIMHVSY